MAGTADFNAPPWSLQVRWDGPAFPQTFAIKSLPRSTPPERTLLTGVPFGGYAWAMKRYDWQSVPEEAMPADGSVLRRFVGGERMTVGRVAFARGSSVPAHRHETSSSAWC
jgi:hypothetical protein